MTFPSLRTIVRRCGSAGSAKSVVATVRNNRAAETLRIIGFSSVRDWLLCGVSGTTNGHGDDHARVVVLEHDDGAGIIGEGLDLLQLGFDALMVGTACVKHLVAGLNGAGLDAPHGPPEPQR